MRQVSLLSDLDLLIRCDTITDLRGQPRVRLLVMKGSLGVALGREFPDHFVDLLIRTLQMMLQVVLLGQIFLFVMNTQVSLLLVMMVILGIGKRVRRLVVVAAAGGLVLGFRLLVRLRCGVRVDFLFCCQAPLLNLQSTVLLILNLHLSHWLDGGCRRHILI
jgi:hypothetical protein